MESATGYKVRERLSRLPRLGLRSRLVAALVATAAATLAWDRERGEPKLAAEITPEREAELLG